jgi:hypothetical protein
MAFEDSHTLFVVRWLELLGIEKEISRWYEYKKELRYEKKKKRRVYSRLYEFFSLVAGDYPDREEEMAEAYDYVLEGMEVEEKVQI